MPQADRLVPTNDFVLLEEEPYEPYDQYKGYSHIIVPDRFAHGPEDRAVMGTVVAKGNQCRNEAVILGSRIVIGKWDGARFPRDGKTLILVKEDSILAVVT